MNNRPLPFSALLLLVLAIALVGIEELSAQSNKLNAARPNVLIMMSDDQGYGDIGSHGNPYLKTPNIESIGAQGAEMTHFFTYPSCSPTRAGLLTGRYPFRTGVVGVTQVEHLMNTSERTIAEILGSNGYRTGIFGKWHLGDNHPMRPTDQGFQEALVHKGGGIGQAAGPADNSYFDPVLEHNNVSKKYKGYCDDIFTDAAIDFIQKKDGKPFLAYLATNLPHFPLDVPDYRADPYRKMGLHEDNARTYGMIDNIDSNVGKILTKLKELGIEKNTIVIFLSDNGPRDRRTKNDVYPGRWVANLRGTKTSVYDNGIRVPFFVRWPGHIPPSTKLDQMGTMIDILPTVLEACNISKPNGLKLDGKSLLSLWEGKGEKQGERTFFTQLHGGPTPFEYMHFAVRTQKYKLIGPQDNPHGILCPPSDPELSKVLATLELYDVEGDPSERVNLAKKHPEIVTELLSRYEDWFHDVTQEREAKGVQRIFIGTKAQPSVSLSRFDWGGNRALSGTQIGNLGHWRVQSEAGTYRVTLHFDPASAEGVAHLKYNGEHIQIPVSKGQRKVVFNEVKLPAGTGNLLTYLKIQRLPMGPEYVDVERIDG
ncbi:arylsulfatase [Persicitalea sp.]|uniref:arylsulfatase n=1 Tax=Persicitalea sp. TaxID=3100273 RepID=UPI0035941025